MIHFWTGSSSKRAVLFSLFEIKMRVKLTRVNAIRRKLKSVRKKLFPGVWGCTGEMAMNQFRRIIISMWLLLTGLTNITKHIWIEISVSLILGTVNSALIPFEGGFFSGLGFGLATFGSIFVGAIVCGLGTSIYSAADQDGDDMIVRKALFSMMVRRIFLILVNLLNSDYSIPIRNLHQYCLCFHHSRFFDGHSFHQH